MSDISINISLPMDDAGYFRRECPLCLKEFKIIPDEKDVDSLTQRLFDSYMSDASEMLEDEEGEVTVERTCPYCGQKANDDTWWTQGQLDYMQVFAENLMKKLMNEQFIRPMKRQFRGNSNDLISLKFDAKELKQEEPWIAPEVDDMDVFELPCCDTRIKLADLTACEEVYCFYCGFPHANHQK